MHKLFLFLFLIAVNLNLLRSQNSISVSGFITDGQSGEKLIGAYIVDSNSHICAKTNNFGFFSLGVKKGSYKFLISYVGYKLLEFSITLKKDTLIQIELTSELLIQEVVVTAENPNRIHP